MRKKRRIISIGIIFSLVLTGCSGKTEVPELIEPVVNNQSFRPVERGDVGNMVVKLADVVPEEYCHFMKLSTKISEICVDVGQYVEEGTVLAVTDIAEQKETLEEKSAELTLQNTLSANNEKIYQEQLKELNLKKETCKALGDKSGVKEYDTQIAIAEENQRYDKLLAKHNQTVLQEEIAELKEGIEEATLKARHAGYVTYVKDLSEIDTVNSMENVVIISDYNELHLELEDNLTSDFYRKEISRYDRIYTEIAGKKYTVKPFDYTNAQMLAIQSAELYPRIRLDAEGVTSGIKPGDKIPVYFTKDQKQNVLKIGTDSLYNEGDTYFVYVQNGEKKKKREIQIGYMNDLYVEVTDGLEEGEWVLYSSEAVMPDAYENYAVEKQVYNMEANETGLRGQIAYTKLYAYTQSEAATVETLNFAEGDTVAKGDLLCVLDLETGSAKLREQQQAISNLKADYTKSKKEYDAQIAGLEKQIKQLNKEKASNSRKMESSAGSKKETEILHTGKMEEAWQMAAPDTTQAEAEVPESTEETETTESEPTEDTKTTESEPAEKPNTTESEALTGDKDEQGTKQDTTAEDGAGQNTESNSGQNTGDGADTENGDDKEPQEEAVSAEQLICEKNILIYQRDNLTAQYVYDSQILQMEYDKLAEGNDGHGKVEVYANQDGILRNVNIYEGKEINPEKDVNLFQICDVTSRKLMVNTKEDYAGAGNEVTLYPKDDKTQSFTAEIIGNSAVADKVYLSGEDGKIYVTQSRSSQEGNRVYIAVEDSQSEEMLKNAEVFYSKARLQNAVVLPGTMVSKEVNKWKPNVTLYYVWRVVDDVLVKQYVTTDESLNTLTETCILDGLSEGDIVAEQIVEK